MSGVPTIATPATTKTNRESLDEGNGNSFDDHMRNLGIGSVLRGLLPQQLRSMVPATDANCPGGTAVKTIVLAKHARAARIERAYARTGQPGELTPDTGIYAAPASTHIAVQPDGNIAVLSSDSITNVDVLYVPEFGDVIDLPSLPVAANSLAIPAAVLALGDVVLLLSAVVDAGVTLGAKHINPPAATNAATTTANLDLAKNHVLFSSATDAVTAATVSLLVAKRADVMSYLSAQATLL